MPQSLSLEELQGLSHEVEAFVRGLPSPPEAIRFHAGEYLIREGEEEQCIYLVLRGAYVVERSSSQGSATGQPAEGGEGRPTVIAAAAGDIGEEPVFVGEMAYLGSGIRTASVRATFNTDALELLPEQMEIMLAQCPGLTRTLCRQFAERLKETSDALDEMARSLAVKAEPVKMPADTQLWEAGQPADVLYQRITGLVVRSDTGAPVPVIEDFLEPGPFLGGGTYAYAAKTDSPCMLVRVPASSKQALVRNYPAVVLELLAELCS